jgi:CHRD domain
MGNGERACVRIRFEDRPLRLVCALAAGMLIAGCGAVEDPSTAPPVQPSPELAAMQPELERVMRTLEGLDHVGQPKSSLGLTAAGVAVQLGSLADRTFVAMADGGEEVPTPVTTGATAVMALILDPRRGDILFSLLHGVFEPTAAHIHRAPAGVNGPIVVPLDHRRRLSFGFARLTASDVALLQAGGLYTNVHSQRFPAGEVRGQLLRLGEALYTASMSGAEESTPRPTTAIGHLAVILNSRQNKFRASGSFQGLSTVSTAAHIHFGVPGADGPVRFPLNISPPGMLGGSLSAISPIGAAEVALLDAGGLYVNVHSMMFPAGEIRGQLLRR